MVADSKEKNYKPPFSQPICMFYPPATMQTKERNMRSFMVYIAMYFEDVETPGSSIIRHQFKVCVDKTENPLSRDFIKCIKDYICESYYFSSPDTDSVHITHLCVFEEDDLFTEDLSNDEDFLNSPIKRHSKGDILFIRFLGRCLSVCLSVFISSTLTLTQHNFVTRRPSCTITTRWC